MKTCGCCGKEGPDEWFTTPSRDLCTRCRLAGKRVRSVVCVSDKALSRVPVCRHPSKLAVRRERRAAIADAIRRKLRYAVFRADSAFSLEAYEYFGCAISVLRERIRSRLPEGVRWEDYGRTWGLSFKRALSTYRLEQPAEFRKATSFRNATVVLLDKKGTVIRGPFPRRS